MKKRLYPLLSLILVFVFGLSIFTTGNRVRPVLAASGGKIYIDPVTASGTINGIFTVRVRVSSPSPINAAFVNINYNNNGLQLMSAQRGSGFPNQNSQTQYSTGLVKMQSTRDKTESGDFQFAILKFKAIANGTWGVRPGTDSSIINYPSNTVAFTIGRADYTVSTPTPPVVTPPTTPTPTPTPTPKPTPKPTPTPTPKPSGSRGAQSPAAPTGPVASDISDSGMQITDLTVTEQAYRGALITWNTTKPSASKINYSSNFDDLSSESLKEEAATSHSIRLEGDTLRAGKHYYVRITADDGSGPTTLDTEFDTKPISVIVKATDTDDNPVVDALIQAGDVEGNTDENGEVTLELPEGDVSVFAQKDELSKELSETIQVPTDENIQRITLSLSKTAATAKVSVPKSKSAPWWIFVLPVVFIAALVAFLLWRKRNQRTTKNAYYGDPLEAENYTQEVIPSTPTSQLPQDEVPAAPNTIALNNTPPLPSMPEPEYMPLNNLELPHHSTLPELVGRYGTESTTQKPGNHTLPEVDGSLSPTGQEIPKHTSLKDLVETPREHDAFAEPNPSATDLPTSPRDLADLDTESEKTTHSNKHSEKHSSGSLTIEH